MSTPDQGSRELRAGSAFVELADTLVAEFDLPAFLSRLAWHCVDLLQAAGAGVMLAAPHDRLRLLASSSEQVRLLELFEIDSEAGPCIAAYRSGATVAHIDLADDDARWPAFAARAHQDGLRSVHAIPMRLREHTIGVLNLFDTDVGPLPQADQQLGQSLADVATIGLQQHHLIETQRGVSQQFQDAFNTRFDVEQAKGMLAERLGINPAAAFQRLRDHARNTNRRLADLARDVLTGKATLPPDDVPEQPDAAIAYARRAANSAQAAAHDAQRSAQAAVQAQQATDAARQRLAERRRPDAHRDSSDTPA